VRRRSDFRHARHDADFERGAPIDFYTRADADRTIAAAEAILEFCRNQIDRRRADSAAVDRADVCEVLFHALPTGQGG